jgi:hypothetical protein
MILLSAEKKIPADFDFCKSLAYGLVSVENTGSAIPIDLEKL